VAAERVALAGVLVAGGGDLNELQNLLKRLTQAHTARMAAVGLNN